MEECDVLICGAGPSGTYLGKLCSEKGLRVKIIDSRQEIGIPLYSGELIDLNLLKGILPVTDDQLNFHPVGDVEYYLTDPEVSRKPIRFIQEKEKSSGTVDRERLDKEMAAMAALSGVDIGIRSSISEISRTKDGVIAGIARDGKILKILCRTIVRADGPDLTETKQPANAEAVSGRIFSNAVRSSSISLGIHSKKPFTMDLEKGEGFRNIVLLGGGTTEMIDLYSGWLSMHRFYFRQIYPAEPYASGVINIGSRCIGPEPFFLSGIKDSLETSRYALTCILQFTEGIEEEKAASLFTESVRNHSAYIQKSIELLNLLKNLTPEGIGDLQTYLSQFEIQGIGWDHLLRQTGLSMEEIRKDFH